MKFNKWYIENIRIGTDMGEKTICQAAWIHKQQYIDSLGKLLQDSNKRLDTCAVYMREDFPAESQSITCQVKETKKKIEEILGSNFDREEGYFDECQLLHKT